MEQVSKKETKQELINRLLRIKKDFHVSGVMEPTVIGELEWFLKLRKSGQQGSDFISKTLFGAMKRQYEEFTDEEIQDLIDMLRAD